MVTYRTVGHSTLTQTPQKKCGMALHSAVRYISVYLFESCFTFITFQLGFPLSWDFSNFQVLGLLDFFSPGTTGPSRSLVPVLSHLGTFPGLSRDFPGTGQSCWKAYFQPKTRSNLEYKFLPIIFKDRNLIIEYIQKLKTLKVSSIKWLLLCSIQGGLANKQVHNSTMRVQECSVGLYQ